LLRPAAAWNTIPAAVRAFFWRRKRSGSRAEMGE